MPARGPQRGGVRFLAPALYLLLLVGFAAGIWGSYRAVFPGRNLYRVSGVLVTRPGDTMILVRHEAVPGLMEGMQSMLFFVESRDLLDRARLSPGDRIRLTVKQTPDRLLVVEVQKIQ